MLKVRKLRLELGNKILDEEHILPVETLFLASDPLLIAFTDDLNAAYLAFIYLDQLIVLILFSCVDVGNIDRVFMNFAVRVRIPILNEFCLRVVLSCLQVTIDIQVRLKYLHEYTLSHGNIAA